MLENEPPTGAEFSSIESNGYQTKDELVQVGSGILDIRLLLDRQQFFDPHGEAERLGICSASWPLFGMLWPSACILANEVSSMALDSSEMLEVGCGLGLASLVAQGRGARITASDYHPLAEHFLQENAARNQLDRIAFHRCDWRSLSPTLGKFGTIVASDVLYQRDHAALLSEFIDYHANATCEVIVVDPGRGEQNRFARDMATFGFVHTAEIPVPSMTHCGRFAGKIHRFSRA